MMANNGSPSLLARLRSLPWRREAPGLGLLLLAVGFTAWFGAPEYRINQLPDNDLAFHFTAIERLDESFARGEPFLDPWVSEWALGYPMWTSYQPLAHVAGVAVLRIFRGWAKPISLFSAFYYFLLFTLPVSVYLGARLLGLPPPAAGLAAILVYAPSATGMPGGYGIGYGSVLFRGIGLYTQLFALHMLAISLGMTARALDQGSRLFRILAAVMLAATGLSHIIFGYAAFVSAGALAVFGPAGERGRRLARLVTIVLPALLLLAWFVVPMWLHRDVINHSRFEDARKWDSYGAPFILKALFTGDLLDFGRLPALSILLGIGAAGAAFCYSRATARRLMALTVLWLALFFGRATWGHLVVLFGVPADLHMHRLEAVFELSAILLGCYGLAQVAAWLASLNRLYVWGLIATVAAYVTVAAVERAAFLKQDAAWGDENLAAYAAERTDIEATIADVKSILAERPGRVSAGMHNTAQFKVGSMPFFMFLSLDHIDHTSFLYHSMSRSSDPLLVRDENSAVDDIAYGIRAVVAPSTQRMPAYLIPRGVHGRFAVYESSQHEGYFGLARMGGHYNGPSSTQYDVNVAWLNSKMPGNGAVVSLDPRDSGGPEISHGAPVPDAAPRPGDPQGEILSESKTGEVYRARVETSGPAYADVKITWNPALAATVDGRPAPVIQVTPGFGAVPVPAGLHDVEVSYQPGPLRPILLLLGWGCAVLFWVFLGRPAASFREKAAGDRVDSVLRSLRRPSVAVGAVILLAGLVALHPLFQGRLIAGHDSVAYPARVIEMGRALIGGHFPPVWGPDLSSGHGQPIFEFNPPLVYWIALPFRAEGFNIADSLQLSIALLFLFGAVSMYRLGRFLGVPRYAAAGGAVAWLFGPYLCTDLYVRVALAESVGMALAPFALWRLLAAMERPSPAKIAWGAAACGLILLSHNLVALLMFPVLAVIAAAYGGAILQSRRKAGESSFRRQAAPLLSAAAVLTLAVGWTAYFWLPSLAEMSYIRSADITSGKLNWTDHVVYPLQLLWSRWGYGLSIPGPHDDMSFDLGPAHLALAAAGAYFALRSGNRKRRALTAGLIVMALTAAWLTTNLASFVWERVRAIQFLQYPWRALLVPGLILPVLAVFAFERIGRKWTIVALSALVLINLPHTEARDYLTFADEYYYPESIAVNGIETASNAVYVPRWAESPPGYSPVLLAGLTRPIEATLVSRKAARQEFVAKTSEPVVAEAATLYYPGWVVQVDGVPVPVTPVPVRGTMAFALPAGEHRVILQLTMTPLREAACWISIATLLAMAAIFPWSRRRQFRSGRQG